MLLEKIILINWIIIQALFTEIIKKRVEKLEKKIEILEKKKPKLAKRR